MRQKRIATIQDLSCFGKCSLTVAQPVMSAMGLEVCPVPTALLSTHTGGFPGWRFHDLTDMLLEVTGHWKELGLRFDAISTGYLGSEKQIEIVGEIFRMFPRAARIVDPVFADHGRLYAGFSQQYAKQMAGLCGIADVIVPNLTEACLMLGESYAASGYDEAYIHSLLRRLADLGCRTVILTGVTYEPEHQGVVAYDAPSGLFLQYFRENIDASFHGTGDIFTSVLAGALTLGKPLERALQIAVDFTVETIKETLPHRDVHWYGVRFEPCLKKLTDALEQG